MLRRWRGPRANLAFAPGTGTPVPGGMTSREAFHLLRALKGVKLAGMDLVEVCPALDHADITSHLGAHLLFEGLALMAWRRGQGFPNRSSAESVRTVAAVLIVASRCGRNPDN